VGNESQGWSRAVIDYPVPYGEDLNRIRQLMDQAADSMYREPGWREVMLEKPEVWGAQELSSKEVTMRIVAKTAPMQQWKVARELRARVKAELDAAGIAPAGPDTIVITAPSGPGDQAEAGVAEPVVAERLAEAGVAERLAEPAGAEPAGAEPAVAERLAEEEGSGGAGTP
jgi:small conductance mechanosensitive channel